jgi:hypothetical protein
MSMLHGFILELIDFELLQRSNENIHSVVFDRTYFELIEYDHLSLVEGQVHLNSTPRVYTNDIFDLDLVTNLSIFMPVRLQLPLR